MRLLASQELGHWIASVVNVATGGYRALIPGLLVRVVTLAAGVPLVLLPTQRHEPLVSVTIVGLAIALIAPATAGSGLALGGALAGWLASGGWQASPDLLRTVVFGYAVYLVHTCTALAAAAPLTARITGSVLQQWSLRSLIASCIAGVLIAATCSLGRLDSSIGLQAAGLAGVVGVVTVSVWFANRTQRSEH